MKCHVWIGRHFLSVQVYCSVKPNLSAFAPCTAISFLSLFLVCDNKFLKTLPTSHFLLKILKVYSPRGKCTLNTVLKLGMALFRPMANRRRLRKQTGHLTLDINCTLPDLMLNSWIGMRNNAFLVTDRWNLNDEKEIPVQESTGCISSFGVQD